MPLLHDFRFADFNIAEATFDDAELDAFDARKLEELAERLLTDITAEMEEDIGSSDESVAQIKGHEQPLPGSVVGATAECLESRQSKTMGGTATDYIHQCSENVNIRGGVGVSLQSQKFKLSTIPSEIVRAKEIEDSSQDSVIGATTVYGTYDAKSDTIAVCTDDMDEPCNEIVEEIYSENKTDEIDDLRSILSASSSTQSPIRVDDNINRMKATDDCSSNVYLNSGISDCGYESGVASPPPNNTLSSPTALNLFVFNDNNNDIIPSTIALDESSGDLKSNYSDYYWPGSGGCLEELFPELI